MNTLGTLCRCRLNDHTAWVGGAADKRNFVRVLCRDCGRFIGYRAPGGKQPRMEEISTEESEE